MCCYWLVIIYVKITWKQNGRTNELIKPTFGSDIKNNEVNTIQ